MEDKHVAFTMSMALNIFGSSLFRRFDTCARLQEQTLHGAYALLWEHASLIASVVHAHYCPDQNAFLVSYNPDESRIFLQSSAATSSAASPSLLSLLRMNELCQHPEQIIFAGEKIEEELVRPVSLDDLISNENWTYKIESHFFFALGDALGKSSPFVRVCKSFSDNRNAFLLKATVTHIQVREAKLTVISLPCCE